MVGCGSNILPLEALVRAYFSCPNLMKVARMGFFKERRSPSSDIKKTPHTKPCRMLCKRCSNHWNARTLAHL